jgi:hypothetical protein
LFINNHIKYLLILILSVLFLPSFGLAGQYAWVDHRNALTTNMRVCSNESANIKVDIPSEFLETQGEQVALVAEVSSLFHEYTYADFSLKSITRLHINSKHSLVINRDLSKPIEIKIK